MWHSHPFPLLSLPPTFFLSLVHAFFSALNSQKIKFNQKFVPVLLRIPFDLPHLFPFEHVFVPRREKKRSFKFPLCFKRRKKNSNLNFASSSFIFFSSYSFFFLS